MRGFVAAGQRQKRRTECARSLPAEKSRAGVKLVAATNHTITNRPDSALRNPGLLSTHARHLGAPECIAAM